MNAAPSDEDLAEELLIMHGRMRRALIAGKNDEATASQTAVLGRLVRDGSQSTADLARAEGVRPQSMGATVGALVDLGYVEREADPRDGRKSVVHVTAAGRAAREASHQGRSRVLTERLAALSPDDRSAIARGLEAISTLLDPETTAAPPDSLSR